MDSNTFRKLLLITLRGPGTEGEEEGALAKTLPLSTYNECGKLRNNRVIDTRVSSEG